MKDRVAQVDVTANEKSVTGEDRAVVAILKQVADAILGVAGRVQSFDLDVVADRESVSMAGSLGDLIAVLSADDGKGITLEDFSITAGVVVVTALGKLAKLRGCNGPLTGGC